MTLRWILAAVHLIALAIGAGAIFNRAREFDSELDPAAMNRLFAADTRWGIAAALWISTGLWRAFAGLEKPPAFYWESNAFWLKMVLLAGILVLEIWPMTTLIKWRVRASRDAPIDTTRAPTFARISWLQLALLIAMVFAAAAMARGMWN